MKETYRTFLLVLKIQACCIFTVQWKRQFLQIMTKGGLRGHIATQDSLHKMFSFPFGCEKTLWPNAIWGRKSLLGLTVQVTVHYWEEPGQDLKQLSQGMVNPQCAGLSYINQLIIKTIPNRYADHINLIRAISQLRLPSRVTRLCQVHNRS